MSAAPATLVCNSTRHSSPCSQRAAARFWLCCCSFIRIRSCDVRSRGDGALHMAREMKPDAILLDILLPDRNGFDVLKDLKSSGDTKDIPVIVVSGLDDSNTAFELGAAEYIRKPFDMVALLENVRALA